MNSFSFIYQVTTAHHECMCVCAGDPFQWAMLSSSSQPSSSCRPWRRSSEPPSRRRGIRMRRPAMSACGTRWWRSQGGAPSRSWTGDPSNCTGKWLLFDERKKKNGGKITRNETRYGWKRKKGTICHTRWTSLIHRVWRACVFRRCQRGRRCRSVQPREQQSRCVSWKRIELNEKEITWMEWINEWEKLGEWVQWKKLKEMLSRKDFATWITTYYGLWVFLVQLPFMGLGTMRRAATKTKWHPENFFSSSPVSLVWILKKKRMMNEERRKFQVLKKERKIKI